MDRVSLVHHRKVQFPLKSYRPKFFLLIIPIKEKGKDMRPHHEHPNPMGCGHPTSECVPVSLEETQELFNSLYMNKR